MFLITFKDTFIVYLIDMGIPYSFLSIITYLKKKKKKNPKPLFYKSLPHGKHEIK